MKRGQRQYFSGDTLEQAVMSAARHYRIDPDQMLYQRVEKRHGFLKMRRRVVIQVDPENPYRPADADSMERTLGDPGDVLEARAKDGNRIGMNQLGAQPDMASRGRSDHVRPRQDRPGPDSRGYDRRTRGRDRDRSRSNSRRADYGFGGRPGPGSEYDLAMDEADDLDLKPLGERFPLATGAPAEAARKAVDLLAELAKLQLTVAVLQGEEQLEIDLSGTDCERVTADEGRLLLAIQHLVPRLIQRQLGERIPCRVDCHQYQERREGRLRILAERVALDVGRYERPKTLRSMNPADRRIVHLALADDPNVETESSGDGYYKRITVRPARQ